MKSFKKKGYHLRRMRSKTMIKKEKLRLMNNWSLKGEGVSSFSTDDGFETNVCIMDDLWYNEKTIEILRKKLIDDIKIELDIGNATKCYCDDLFEGTCGFCYFQDILKQLNKRFGN